MDELPQMIMNEELFRKKLFEYIDNEQVAFQYCDELMDFTHISAEESDAEHEREQVEQLKSTILKDALLPLNMGISSSELLGSGFDELKKWAQEDDQLILVGDVLLLCLPAQSRAILKLTA